MVELAIAVTSIAAMRAFKPIINDELELIVRWTPELGTMVFVESPARHFVGWRKCVLAVWARSRLVAGSDYDIGNGAEE